MDGKIYSMKTVTKKRAGVSVLIANKIDFKASGPPLFGEDTLL
jgi:hypothetical protein